MTRKDKSSSDKLEKLKQIRQKRLVKELLDIQLRGVDHKIYITKDFKADLTVNDGKWITDDIRSAIVKHNYDIDKIPSLQVKDFKPNEIKAYEEECL